MRNHFSILEAHALDHMVKAGKPIFKGDRFPVLHVGRNELLISYLIERPDYTAVKKLLVPRANFRTDFRVVTPKYAPGEWLKVYNPVMDSLPFKVARVEVMNGFPFYLSEYGVNHSVIDGGLEPFVERATQEEVNQYTYFFTNQ